MRLYANQLASHLRSDLLPAYLVAGDDILLAQEAADAVRRQARARGFSERVLIDGASEADWAGLVAAGRAMSLFAQRQLIEVRMRKSKADEPAQRALLEYLQQPAADNLLLVTAPKLERGVDRQKWFTRLAECGAVVSVMPLKTRELPGWLRARALAAGLELDREAVAMLAERSEGNLLALSQELEKLSLLLGAGRVTAQQVAQAVSDSARFNIFDLGDTCLAGDRRRVLRMFTGLQSEGAVPAQVLWWLSRDLRLLATMAHELEQGKALERVLAEQHIWDSRKPLFRKALAESLRARWAPLLARCAQLDRRSKGMDTGNIWDDLLELGLQMS